MDHLWYSVALHLPLQLLWRLIPLSSNLRRILSYELFWRTRCEREFPLLHDVVTNYREYFVRRTESGYGQLYIDGEKVSGMNHAKELFSLGDRYFVLTTENKLYRIRRDSTTELLFTDVKRVIKKNDHPYNLDQAYLTVITNTTWITLLEAHHKRKGYQLIELQDALPFDVVNFFEYNRSIRIYLTTDGSLYYRNRKIVTSLKVLQLIHETGDLDPILLLSDGRLVNWPLQLSQLERNDGTAVDHLHVFYANIIRADSFGQRMYFGTNVRKKIDGVNGGGASIGRGTITTDGRGRIHGHHLMSNELRYEGLIDVRLNGEKSFIVAMRKREKARR